MAVTRDPQYKNPSARDRLQVSKLSLTQLELMGQDVDLNAFKLEMGKVMPYDILEAITDATVERTTAGASTLSVPVLDKDRILLKSGAISKQVDVKIDGLFFRLTQFKKQDDIITLIFEDREIAVLRTYKKPIKASGATDRSNITRAEFILRLIREPKEYKHNPIPYFIPDLHKVEPVGLSNVDQAVNTSADQGRHFGINPGAAVAVKGRQASPTQIKNINTILMVGTSMVLPRAVLVVAIMTAIQESSITNLPPGVPGDYNYLSSDPSGNPVGVFQQIPKYWRSKGGATSPVAKDARAFFNSAKVAYSRFPNAELWKICLLAQDEPVEASIGLPYGRWLHEADLIVTAFGIPKGQSQAEANNQFNVISGSQRSADYEFYRGVPPQQGENIWLPEDSWTCITRLAQEVNWRAFFVSGTFFYLDDDRLFSSKPRMRVTEGKNGVDLINGDYDERKKNSTLTLNCRIGRWSVPPGAVVELYDMGPMDGRWLVTDVSRSLFNDQGTITLQKPQPQLPEPVASGGSKLGAGVGRGGKKGDPASGYANPFPGGWIPNRLDMGWDGTFSGHIVAPFDGTITYNSYIGGDNPWGGYVVIKADSNVPGLPTRSLYFAEGLDGVIAAGAKVKAGDVIARAAKSPYGDPYGTHSDGQIEWGVAVDSPVGVYSKPYAQQLGLGSDAAARMVKNFIGWAHQSLGVPGNPTSSSDAGRS